MVRLTKDGITLENNQVDQVDAIVYATGWRPSYETFFDVDQAADLGLSVLTRNTLPEAKSKYQDGDNVAETEILQEFPALRDPPRNVSSMANSRFTPFRLYRYMVPTNPTKYPGIVFLGHLAVGNNFRASEVQAMWAMAYLEKFPNPLSTAKASPPKIRSTPLSLPDQPKMEDEVARQVAWNRVRYLSKGQQGVWLYYDLVSYTDRLLEDLGLSSSYRARHSRWANLWKAYVAEDLRGLLDELIRRLQHG